MADRCRVCKSEVKPYQTHCPNCGAKNPLIKRSELKEFKTFERKLKPYFNAVVLIIVSLFLIFTIKIPVIKEIPYNVKDSLVESKQITKDIRCFEEEFDTEVKVENYFVFDYYLEVHCNVRNLEGKNGTFEYLAQIINKKNLKQKNQTSMVFLNEKENKTIKFRFGPYYDKPDFEHPICLVIPPNKTVCKERTERGIVKKDINKEKVILKKEYLTIFEWVIYKTKKLF